MAMDVLRDARTYTTPLGAIAGLVLARHLVAKKDRNVFNQGAGAAAGAAAGYVGGGYLQDHLDTPEKGDTAGYMDLIRKHIRQAGPGNRATLTEKDLMNVSRALPASHRLPESGIDKDLRPAYLARMGNSIYSAVGKEFAAEDPAWNDYSTYRQEAADKVKGNMPGLNSASTHILNYFRDKK